MQRALVFALSAGLSASILGAQSGTGPGFRDADTTTAGHQALAPSVYFRSAPGGASGPKTLGDITSPAPIWNATGTKNILQVHATKNGMSGLKAGEYSLSFTVTSLNTKYGAIGTGQQVVMGKVSWDSAGQPTFVPHLTMAAKMNVTGNCFGLMIDDKDGRRASVDHPSGPRWSLRADNSKDFPASVALTGITRTYVDPTPSYINGVLGVMWVSGATTITWAPVKETVNSSGALTAAAIDVTKSVIMVTASDQPHSPCPIVNHTNGDTQGLWFSRSAVSGDSDMHFTGTLPSSGGNLVFNNANWSNNGAVCGSRFLCAYTGHNAQLLEGRASYGSTNNNITVGAGAKVNLQLVSPVNPKNNTFVNILGLNTAYIKPVTLTGILGELAINPIFIINNIAIGTTADERANATAPAAAKFLKGATLILQNVCGPVKDQAALTNTIPVTFK